MNITIILTLNGGCYYEENNSVLDKNDGYIVTYDTGWVLLVQVHTHQTPS